MGRANGWSGQPQPLKELDVVQLNCNDYLTIMKINDDDICDENDNCDFLAPKCYCLHNLILRIKG